ncbi:sulfatase-like hydrolase/transferase [Haloarcula sp. 1CSR25-25]|uniref:sulfatase-like hydrolase/transferase n=1 Tax=Haloarcula sp. 1CSR25-25 TaxID=2862545 RepID=UPI002893E179|nr:sulfatase-like hydrolase/transferase [Haloarcula sp. 1CSR25-25]MDT3435480.1 sulfatase-like hydrolase/transferase [Haloarcula sp. 1CSR25-25]
MQSLKPAIERAIYNSHISKELLSVYLLFWMAVTTHRPIGHNIYDSNWDLLIVLDACRVDALRSVEDEYSFIEEVMEITSLGSTSLEWMLKTFTERHLDEIRKTHYISTNGHLGQLSGADTTYFTFLQLQETVVARTAWANQLVKHNAVSEEDFAAIHRLYHLSERNPYGHTPLPDDVTDYAIQRGRELSDERLIVHYMQPHAPYLKQAFERGTIADHEASPFTYLRSGGSNEAVREAYLDNLRFVLDSIERLLDNIDAERVVITADHGELFGEFSLYSHGAGVFHPNLKRVPWVETTARDTDGYIPDIDDETKQDSDELEKQVKDQLEGLGYL